MNAAGPSVGVESFLQAFYYSLIFPKLGAWWTWARSSTKAFPQGPK